MGLLPLVPAEIHVIGNPVLAIIDTQKPCSIWGS